LIHLKNNAPASGSGTDRHGLSWNGEVVAQKDEAFARLLVVVGDATEQLRIVGGGLDAGEHNGLLISQASRVVDRT